MCMHVNEMRYERKQGYKNNSGNAMWNAISLCAGGVGNWRQQAHGVVLGVAGVWGTKQGFLCN